MENTESRVPAFVDRWIGKAFEDGCRTPEEFRKAAVDRACKGHSLAPFLNGLIARGILDAETERRAHEVAAERARIEALALEAENARLETLARNLVMRDGVAVLAGAELSA